MHEGGLDEEKYNFLVIMRRETLNYRSTLFRHQLLCQDKGTKPFLCIA